MRHRRLTFVMSLALVPLGLAVACGGDDDEAAPTDPCRGTIDEAGMEAELSRQVELLDRALIICSDVGTFTGHAERHPTLLGWDVDVYLTGRCTTADDDAVRNSRICGSEGVVPTTVAPTDVPEVVYVGRTLDGRDVEVRPRAGRPFDNGVPSVIAEMSELARTEGCEGVEAAYEDWSERTEDPYIGDEASVYAQYALDVLAYIQCDT